MCALKLKKEVIVGIDLAGKLENPTGWALWINGNVETKLVYSDIEILECTTKSNPSLIAIDAPLKLPKEGFLRKADREMIRKGYRVFPPMLPNMDKLTMRAIKLNTLITEKGYKTIEVHPASTRKALGIPAKNWKKIHEILISMGLEGNLKLRMLTPHEIDAITSALTAYLHLRGRTEAIGDEEEGYVIIPKKQNWRKLEI
jgi:predicted nuclease with RNAse H fold